MKINCNFNKRKKKKFHILIDKILTIKTYLFTYKLVVIIKDKGFNSEC